MGDRYEVEGTARLANRARDHTGRKGFIQATSLNRAKSVSAEQMASPCSMANAARSASGMRLPDS